MLSDRLEFYRRALQMQDEGMLSSLVLPSRMEVFQRELADLSRYHVSHAEVRGVQTNEEASEATVTYFIEFYSNEVGLVQGGNFLTTWRFDSASRNWLMDEAHPFGKQILRRK